MYTVYKAENKITGKCYYGSTSRNLNTRLIEHKCRGTFGDDFNDIDIYPLAICDSRSQMFDIESILISTNPDGYNVQGTHRDYKPGNKKVGVSNKIYKGHDIKCLEDNISFQSLREVANQYNIAGTTIARAIKSRSGYVKKINKTFQFI